MNKLVIFYPSDPFGGKVGGINSFIKGLIKCAPQDFEIEWVGITSDPNTRPILHRQEQQIDGRLFIFTPVLHEDDQNIRKTIPLSLRYALSIRKLQRDWSDSILFFHRIEPVVFFKRKQGVKVALVHNDIMKQIYSPDSEVIWSKIPKLYRAFEKAILSHYKRVFSVSETTVNYYQEHYSHLPIKFSFLPTWVDPTVFLPSEQNKQNLKADIVARHTVVGGENEPWFLFVGRLQTQKNPELLVKSFAAYRDKHKNGRLLIVGDGNLRESLQELVNSLQINNQVHFLGTQNRETLKQLYQASDMLLLTSHFEGMPVCVLESLASGLPVISARVGEVARVVSNGFSGEIIESYKAQDYLMAMEKIIANPIQYSASHCVESISPYTPAKVAAPLFAEFRTIKLPD
ncbi:glycosyltransferase family 4 protein [Aliiglaciecola sp. LCG003]|uniref:glycosyltransferase family 4 protein n=1 Tax=Aliiglaciecola sp. LCG003 TaxID=3053655 RepID=UPI002573ED92|nr:glycosyltransferase family 4 protein [Aliiglaciecola sp. LCG003]WJG09739.1 glycosyltransferase family 4 protein [Aliiglaciecola sp. LCG003]